MSEEKTACRKRLAELKAKEGESPVKGPHRLIIDVAEDQLVEFHHLVRRTRTSVSALGQRAIKQLLGQARAGALPITVTETASRDISASVAETGPKMTPEEIQTELETCRRRLFELSSMPENGPNGKGPPRIVVGLKKDEFADIQALSARIRVSASALGRHAIGQLLGQVRSGALPMVRPATAENATDF
jgi:hypothetical protein